MPRLITHVLLPEKFPEETKLATLDYWTQNDFDRTLYYLHGESLIFSKDQIENLVRRGRCIPLPKVIQVHPQKGLLCNSRGEVIFADKVIGPIESDGDWDFVLNIMHAV